MRACVHVCEGGSIFLNYAANLAKIDQYDITKSRWMDGQTDVFFIYLIR